MSRFGFCDRCGKYTEFPECRAPQRIVECYDCELGMHSLAAMLDPRWARAMTNAEVQLAHTWLLIERRMELLSAAVTA